MGHARFGKKEIKHACDEFLLTTTISLTQMTALPRRVGRQKKPPLTAVEEWKMTAGSCMATRGVTRRRRICGPFKKQRPY